jgi:phosphotransferase system  glucose/maltose/N-acetylglucosamine-specific IIC component
MDKLSRGMGYAMAIPTQALGLFAFAWYTGEWLNENHPIGINWFAITFVIAVVAIFHTLYVIVKKELNDQKRAALDEEKKPSEGR